MSEASESSVPILTRASTATHAKLMAFAKERGLMKKENQRRVPNISEAVRVVLDEYFAMKAGESKT
jgi:hypothetical protein